jgi:hypothetical protein
VGLTPAFDRYHAVVSALGDRFLLLRMADPRPAESAAWPSPTAAGKTKCGPNSRTALTGLIEHTDYSKINRELNTRNRDQLNRLATSPPAPAPP